MDARQLLHRLGEEAQVLSVQGRGEALVRMRQSQCKRDGLAVDKTKCLMLIKRLDGRVIHPYIAKMEQLKGNSR